MRISIWLLLVFWVASCAAENESDVAKPEAQVPPEDLIEVIPIKGDGYAFDHNRLIEDSVFVDAGYLTVEQIRAFLEATPYDGKRSSLADISFNGLSVAEIIVEASKKHQINPIVFLTKLQVEMGLVSSWDMPSQHKLDHAMGCACLDGMPCAYSESGFVEQIDCAGDLFRSYLTQIENNGKTKTGWKPYGSKTSEDAVTVTPSNAATAALYTYTPWVLRFEGGNWLFWNVYRKYSRHMLKTNPNHHWIGGTCAGGAECSFENGQCILNDYGGFCTRPCEGFCPDSSAPYSSVTFCVELGTAMSGIPGGWCVSRCDWDLFADTGCKAGDICVDGARYLHESVVKKVCLPQWLQESPVEEEPVEEEPVEEEPAEEDWWDF